MENKPEVIRQQMQQTRTSLSEKLEELECRVKDTVCNATSAVNETISTVKGAVDETVTTVKEAVGSSACAVKETLGDTMHSVREGLDVEVQVQRHPWTMLGGAVAAGYIGGKLLQRLNEPARGGMPGYTAPTHLPGADWAAPSQQAGPKAARETNGRAAEQTAASHAPGWADTMLAPLKPELENLKGIAVGALFNFLKGMIRQHTPPALDRPLEEAVDRLTTRFGGRRLEGSIMDEPQDAFR